MSTPGITVSVIVITFNRREKLSRCLAALQKQSLKPGEVVVVIDGSSDGTSEMLTSPAFKDLPLNVINKANEGRSLSRNHGARQASGKIIVLFDDDMIPHPECIEEHVKLVTNNPGAISVGTQEEDPNSIDNDFARFRHHVTLKWESALTNGKHTNYLTGANFCMSREAFLSLEGFDKRAVYAEDVDMGLRAAARGMQLVYNSKARAWHDNKLDCQTYIRKQIEYHRGHLNLLSIHPEYSKSTAAEALYKPGLLKRFVYHIVSRPFFVDLIDRDRLTYLPRRLRYKLYDVIITGLAKVYPSRFTLQAIRQHG